MHSFTIWFLELQLSRKAFDLCRNNANFHVVIYKAIQSNNTWTQLYNKRYARTYMNIYLFIYGVYNILDSLMYIKRHFSSKLSRLLLRSLKRVLTRKKNKHCMRVTWTNTWQYLELVKYIINKNPRKHTETTIKKR